MLRAYFLFLNMACLEAVDPISVILGRTSMFTILNWLKIFSRPAIPQEYFSFFGSLTCFGVTAKLFMLKSYYETSETDSAVSTLGYKSSAAISISLE